jgi:hypothetical protein
MNSLAHQPVGRSKNFPRSHIRMPLVALLAILSCHLAMAATSVSRNGVTWNFSNDRQVGQYCNGDWWVVGPVTITGITPASSNSSGSWINGSMLNPRTGSTQGFDNRFIATYNPYDDTLNVGNKLPLTLPADSSLVSAVSAPSYQQWGLIQSFSVLTIVSSPPPAGSFRPSYSGTGSRASRWKESDLNYNALQRLPRSGMNLPSVTGLATDFLRFWFERDLNWTGRYMHTPYQALNGYGKDMAIKTGNAALLLNLDYTNAEKRDLLVGIVQYGIDIAGIRATGARWYDTGGHNIGRLSPLLVAAAVLNDQELKNRCVGSELGFSEYCQTFFVSQADVDRARYTADGRPRLPYTTANIGMPEWGETHTFNPSRDGNNWNAFYRDICGGQLTAPAMAARVMGMRTLVNWEPFFQYQERHLNYEQSAGYAGEFNSNPTPTFHRQFYNAHRNAVPGSGGDPINPPVSAFKIGDRIQVSKDTNVRTSGALTATLLGVQSANSTGTIIGGPVGPDTNNITWWQVDFDSGVDGWTGQDNYTKIEPTRPVAPTGLKVE